MDYSIDGQIKEAEKQIKDGPDELKKFLPAILDDQKAVFESELLPKTTKGKKNAGAFLNERVQYRGFLKTPLSNGKAKPIDCSRSKKLLAIPPRAEMIVASSNRDWAQKANEIDFSKIDLTWMKELLGFDHWQGHYPPDLKEKCLLPPMGSTEINGRSWARLRLLKGLKENDLPQASKEVRHFAFLIASNDHSISTISTLAIFGDEARFISLHEVKSTPLVDPNLVQAVKRLYFTLAGILAFPAAVPEDTFKAILFNEFSIAVFCDSFSNQQVLDLVNVGELKLSDSYIDLYEKLEKRYEENCNGFSVYSLKKKQFMVDWKTTVTTKPSKKSSKEETKAWEDMKKIHASRPFSTLHLYRSLAEEKAKNASSAPCKDEPKPCSK